MSEDRKILGRISKADFGMGGYQDACIGLSLTFSLEGGSSGVCSFDGHWAIKRSDRCAWTEEERIRLLGETVMRLNDLLKKAKKQTVADLIGTPVEVTFKDFNTFKEFRVLTEVI